jgi:hypothetical protein
MATWKDLCAHSEANGCASKLRNFYDGLLVIARARKREMLPPKPECFTFWRSKRLRPASQMLH